MTANDIKSPGAQLAGPQAEPAAAQSGFLARVKDLAPVVSTFILTVSFVAGVAGLMVSRFVVTPVLHEVEQQIDAVEQRLEDRIEGLEDAIDAKITDLADDSDERMDGISVQLAEVRTQLQMVVDELRRERTGGENDAD